MFGVRIWQSMQVSATILCKINKTQQAISFTQSAICSRQRRKVCMLSPSPSPRPWRVTRPIKAHFKALSKARKRAKPNQWTRENRNNIPRHKKVTAGRAAVSTTRLWRALLKERTEFKWWWATTSLTLSSMNCTRFQQIFPLTKFKILWISTTIRTGPSIFIIILSGTSKCISSTSSTSTLSIAKSISRIRTSNRQYTQS